MHQCPPFGCSEWPREIRIRGCSSFLAGPLPQGVTLLSLRIWQRMPVADYVEPLGMRILIRKDEARQKTRGGIVLPDNSEIPTITGRVVEVSVQVDRNEDFPIRKYDKVLFHPRNAIPVDFEGNNLLFVVPIEDVVAVFRRESSRTTRRTAGSTDEADE